MARGTGHAHVPFQVGAVGSVCDCVPGCAIEDACMISLRDCTAVVVVVVVVVVVAVAVRISNPKP